MSRVMGVRWSKKGILLLAACMLFVTLEYAPNVSANTPSATFGYMSPYATVGIVRVAPRVHPYASGYQMLSQYGDWVRLPSFGVVWVPWVSADWEPFYDGQWIWTSDGWAWDSYEPFGDIVYHYGYWYFDDSIGWFWMPGSAWSPACVQWYTYGDYCGWAPLPPPGYYWPDPWDPWRFNVWVVVDFGHFCDVHVGHYGFYHDRYRDIFRRDVAVRRAPEMQRVQTVAHRQITTERIARRPMDIRTATIKTRDKAVVERDLQARRAVPADRGVMQGGVLAPQDRRVVTPTSGTTVQREVATPSKQPRIQREGAAPATISRTANRPVTTAKSVAPQKKVVKPNASNQPQRQVVAPKQSAQPQRQAAQPAQKTQTSRQSTVTREAPQVERKVETRSSTAPAGASKSGAAVPTGAAEIAGQRQAKG